MTYHEQLNDCLAAIKNDDQTRYEEFHQLTYAPLLNVAKSYLIDKSYAEAVISDMYLNIVRYAGHYNPSREAYRYLWQIVKNKCFDYNKQQLKNKTVNIDDIPIFDKVDHFERADMKMDVANALSRLGDKNALIVAWMFRDGLTQEEIGERLGITKSAVCQRLGRIFRDLKTYLKDY